MPLYVYHCSQCQQDFERLVRFSETDQPQACPHCGCEETFKRVTAFASYSPGSQASNAAGSGCTGGGGFT